LKDWLTNLLCSLIPEIDVYDIASGEWSTVGSLPLQYQVSDHAGFAKDDAVYIAGGYTTADYIAVGTVLKIDSDVKFTEVKSLTAPRGDVFGVASDDGTSAFVAGGFTNEDWCSPLDTVEKYTFASDTWVDLPKLATARAEVLLVENDNHLYSLGGEYPLYELCNTSEGITDVGSKTVGTDKVEILMDGEGEWKFLESFPEQLFRFAAVGAAEKDKIYVFGGQTKYEASCECTKTTDHVWVFEKPEDAAAGNHISLFAAFVASVSTFFLMYA
jgi:N-acetylneuraminic acid mutarotase